MHEIARSLTNIDSTGRNNNIWFCKELYFVAHFFITQNILERVAKHLTITHVGSEQGILSQQIVCSWIGEERVKSLPNVWNHKMLVQFVEWCSSQKFVEIIFNLLYPHRLIPGVLIVAFLFLCVKSLYLQWLQHWFVVTSVHRMHVHLMHEHLK